MYSVPTNSSYSNSNILLSLVPNCLDLSIYIPRD